MSERLRLFSMSMVLAFVALRYGRVEYTQTIGTVWDTLNYGESDD